MGMTPVARVRWPIRHGRQAEVKTVKSRDGQWAYKLNAAGKVAEVIHLPSEERMSWLGTPPSLASIRQQAASGDLLRTIEQRVFDREHAMVRCLPRHIGREILVDGQWRTVSRCTGYGPMPDQTSVWFTDDDEPAVLPNGSYVKVRDPEPGPFTVVSLRYGSTGQFWPIAVVAGTVPVVLAGEDEIVGDVEAEVRPVTAPTPDKALAASFKAQPTAPTGTNVMADRWTVVGMINTYRRWYDAIAAFPGERTVQGTFDEMSTIRDVKVVDAGSGAEAIRKAGLAYAEATDGWW